MSGEILSQNEIDVLLHQLESNSLDESKLIEKDKDKNTPKLVDFKRPNKLKSENLGAIKQIHDNMSKMLSNHLSILLRCSIQVENDIEMIDQVAYQEYIRDTSRGNYIWSTFDMEPMNQAKWFLQYDSKFCYYFLSRYYGADSSYASARNEKMSDINKEILKILFKRTLDSYTEVWGEIKSLGKIKYSSLAIKDDPQTLNMVSMRTEMLLIIPLRITINEKKEEDNLQKNYSTLNIGIPFAVIEPILDKLNISSMFSTSTRSVDNKELLKKVRHVPLDIQVNIGETYITFENLLKLKSDNVILLQKKENDPFDISISNIYKGSCIPFRNGKKVCVEIVK